MVVTKLAAWKCSCCGEVHDYIPDSFAFEVPYYWDESCTGKDPEAYILTADYCRINGEDNFIRATLEIPVKDREEPFVFGAWASLSSANAIRESKLANDPNRVNEPSYFGWFANRIWQYPDTLNLRCQVISRAPGLRPLLELEPTDHLLARDHRNGISHERFLELSAQCLHGWKHPDSAV